MVIKKAIKPTTLGIKRLGCYGNTYLKQEKRAVRRTAIPRKHAIWADLTPMAIAILEAERHRNQICRFNHSIEIDSKGRWIIDGETIKSEKYEEDSAKDYIRAAKGLYNLGFGYTYMRNCPTLTDPENGEPVSLTLRDAERIINRSN